MPDGPYGRCLGRRLCGSVPRLRRGQVHHRYRAGRRWRAHRQMRLRSSAAASIHSTPRGGKTMTGNEQKIIDLDKKRMNAMAQKDIATLNALLSDDLVYTHS